MTPVLDAVRREELRKRASEATAFHDGNLMRYEHGGGRLAILPPRGEGDRILIADFYDEANAAYIAAMSPDTTLALLARIAELEANLAAAASAMEAEVVVLRTMPDLALASADRLCLKAAALLPKASVREERG